MPFMVVLKNITKTKDSISANYYPEGDMNKEGFMKMSIPNKKIIEHKKAVECSTAPVHAMYELRGWQTEKIRRKKKRCCGIDHMN